MTTQHTSRRVIAVAALASMAAALMTTLPAQATEPVFKPLYAKTARHLVPATTLHSEGRGVFLENIVATAGGHFAATSLFDGRILDIAPDGSTRTLATLPGHVSGIEADGAGGLIVGGWTKDERRLLWRVQADGRFEEAVALPDAVMPNGITTLSPGVLLVADSVKGLIWRVELERKAVSVWSDHALLGGFDPHIQPAIPAVNGLKRHGAHLYASNMSLNHFVRITIDGDGRAGVAEVYRADVFADDFVIDRSGTIYATTHAYDSVVRIGTDRRVTTLGTRVQGLQGATAAAFARDARGRAQLVVVTNGGIYVPPVWGAEDAKVVRLDIAAARR